MINIATIVATSVINLKFSIICEITKRLIVKHKFVFLIMIVTVFFSGCATKKELILFNDLDQNRTHSDKEVVEEVYLNDTLPIYHIKKYDRLVISIYGGEPEIISPQDSVLVDYNGDITLPLIGNVKVEGLTEPQAARIIQAKYRKKYSKDMVVSVEVAKKKLYVIGEVRKPGVVALPNQKSSLLQAIAEAGSFKDTANREAIYLVRKIGNRATVTRYSLSGRLAINNAFDVVLPGDIIYVAPNNLKVSNLRYGDTLKLIGTELSPLGAVKSLTR